MASSSPAIFVRCHDGQQRCNIKTTSRGGRDDEHIKQFRPEMRIQSA
jgi:hypothetical protein